MKDDWMYEVGANLPEDVDFDIAAEIDHDTTRRYLVNHPLLQDHHPAGPQRAKASKREQPNLPPVVRALAHCLKHLVATDVLEPARVHGPLGAFESSEIPAVSLGDYVERFGLYSNCSPSCFPVAYVYLKRIASRGASDRAMTIAQGNAHRLVLASLVSAVKMMDDVYYKQSFYAQIGGVSVSELNALEREFLYLMDYKLHVDCESFCDALTLMETDMDLEQYHLVGDAPKAATFASGGMGVSTCESIQVLLSN